MFFSSNIEVCMLKRRWRVMPSSGSDLSCVRFACVGSVGGADTSFSNAHGDVGTNNVLDVKEIGYCGVCCGGNCAWVAVGRILDHEDSPSMMAVPPVAAEAVLN